MAALVTAAALAGCVRTLQYDLLSPDRAGAEAALAAAEQSVYLREREELRVATETALREPFIRGGLSGPSEPVRSAESWWGLSGCLRSGGAFRLSEVEVGDHGVCGQDGGERRCIAYAEMRAIGAPRDAVEVGYYPVVRILPCAAGGS